MSMSDAAVALKSLPRRYREIVSGPINDEAWDRLVRSIDGSGRSALGWTIFTTQLVTALGTAVAELPLTARPTIDLAKIVRSRIEASKASTVEEITADLASNAERAASAIAGRSHDDFDRTVLVDGQEVEARTFVAQLVRDAVSHIRDADAAVTAAKDAN
jgi:hypothetical protein